MPVALIEKQERCLLSNIKTEHTDMCMAGEGGGNEVMVRKQDEKNTEYCCVKLGL